MFVTNPTFPLSIYPIFENGVIQLCFNILSKCTNTVLETTIPLVAVSGSFSSVNLVWAFQKYLRRTKTKWMIDHLSSTFMLKLIMLSCKRPIPESKILTSLFKAYETPFFTNIQILLVVQSNNYREFYCYLMLRENRDCFALQLMHTWLYNAAASQPRTLGLGCLLAITVIIVTSLFQFFFTF